jgi:hypothetical protein
MRVSVRRCLDDLVEYWDERVVAALAGCLHGPVGPSADYVLLVLFVARRIVASFAADGAELEWHLVADIVVVDLDIVVEARGVVLGLGALVECSFEGFRWDVELGIGPKERKH